MLKNFKPSSRINRAWWITFAAILIAMFAMGAAAPSSDCGAGDDAHHERSVVDSLVAATGINALISGFSEFTMTEEEIAQKRDIEKQELERKKAAAHKNQLEMEASVAAKKPLMPDAAGQIIMIIVGLLLVYLAIAKEFEPLLLLPIGFGEIGRASCRERV